VVEEVVGEDEEEKEEEQEEKVSYNMVLGENNAPLQ
jgi:hypothetical protein